MHLKLDKNVIKLQLLRYEIQLLIHLTTSGACEVKYLQVCHCLEYKTIQIFRVLHFQMITKDYV